ncbi:MAG: hypothetical protein NC299_08965 [Lachnospiraceae bacterium]|nr:hypothetical protein [Lachnospiraceae bacterium]
MTLEELNSYHTLKVCIEHCRERIREIDGRTVSSPRFDNNGIVNSPSGKNPTEEKYIQAIAKKDELERLAESCAVKIKRIERYISNIRDLRTRLIFEKHIYSGEQFFKIAMKLGGRNSEESVKHLFYRYLRDHPHG